MSRRAIGSLAVEQFWSPSPSDWPKTRSGSTYRELPRSRKASRTASKIGSEQVRCRALTRAYTSEVEAIGVSFEREADSPVC